VLPGDVYRVAELDQTKNGRFATTAHVSQLKSWRIYKEDEQMEDDGEETTEESCRSGTVGGKEVEETSDSVQGKVDRVRRPPVWHNDYIV